MSKIILVALLCILAATLIFEAAGTLDTRSLFAEAAGTSFLTVGFACIAFLIIALLLGGEDEHYD